MYSQNEEEKYILDYFKDKGKYLEIGGYHPFQFSNTRALYECGWKGLILEPIEELYQTFVKEYGEDEAMMIYNYALTEHDGTIDFYKCSDAVSTSDIEHYNKWKNTVPYELITVKSISVETLFLAVGFDFQFMSLDVEGNNYKLFSLLPDALFEKLECVCIEHDNEQDKIKERLLKFGFKEIHFNGENIILAK